MFNHLRKKIVSLMLFVLLATQSASAIEAHSPNRDNNLTNTQLHAVMGIITNFILSSDSTIKLESTPTLEIGSDSVTIKFIANQNAQGQIEYGTSTDYGYTTTKEFSFNYSSHTQTLTNLEAGTTYHYRVHFWNRNGVETVSQDYTFKCGKVNIPVMEVLIRSDWINVKSMGAKGDSNSDDTVAIQNALNLLSSDNTKAGIFFPKGTYLISDTLKIGTNLIGRTIIGQGLNTTIKWNSNTSKPMLLSSGASYTRYIGIVWDGNNKSSIGIYHNSKSIYETGIQHKNEAFVNFTKSGIEAYGGGQDGFIATAEVLVTNCLFENNLVGVNIGSVQFNALDWIIEKSEFRNNTIGVKSPNGGGIIRDIHFENSSEADIVVEKATFSVRRVSSNNSYMFYKDVNKLKNYYFQTTFDNCYIGNWRNPNGVALDYNYRAGALIYDTTFANSPRPDKSPIEFSTESDYWQQSAILFNNSYNGSAPIVANNSNARIAQIGKDGYKGIVKNYTQVFLDDTPVIEKVIFDVTDKNLTNPAVSFNSAHDDYEGVYDSIQKAKLFGHGAIVYVPVGNYITSKEIIVDGNDYTIQGSGKKTEIYPKNNNTIFKIFNARNVNIENMHLPSSNEIYPMTYENSYTGYFDRIYTLHRKNLFLVKNNKKDNVVNIGSVRGKINILNNNGYVIGFDTVGAINIENNKGFIGFHWLNTGHTENDLFVVKNSSSVVIADYFCEQAGRLFKFMGNPNDSRGRITMGAAHKIQSWNKINDDFILIDNYHGDITFLQSFLWKKTEFKTNDIRITQTRNGSNKVDFLLAGSIVYNEMNSDPDNNFKISIPNGTSSVINSTIMIKDTGNSYDAEVEYDIENPNSISNKQNLQIKNSLLDLRKLSTFH